MVADIPTTRDKILQAAAEITKEVGPVNLSLDAVAKRAGLSKGGLLYTFPTKAKLLEGLVEQHVSEFDQSLRREEASRNFGPNSVVLAVIAVYRAEFVCNEPEPSGILAAIANDPGFLEPIRRYNKQLLQRMRENAADPMLAMMVFLTIEGLRSLKLFEMNVLDRAEQIAAIDRLKNLFEPADPAPVETPAVA
ncbi:TetR family transcriptional regulator [Phyllobacterium sp. SYP-B3895]|uniref:TetR/AcrR family transcriptional regulator n=1 Tax=Phyllobacterium pellucidum TaxID=2740464 RepID=A0A849VV58_9HYPH|nr:MULTISPECIES: TetR/AcrR family transcriptional regulator [Phyllobacterium]MRG55274.1 TetR family transcriptional regulator [Phyllobacterium sp. SYP-B3895]NTS33875.1 TetR/AcrR family transcriptional regulator [Phyllobacterium pellucidum]UGY08667.1 TetR/AcrR family transcriptional regulator [Phyllobacterium sp. T1018]